MAARFPQSTTSVGYRIKPAWSSKIHVIYWAASADSVHRLRSGDTATTILTRSTSGATFNSTDGRLSGTSTVYFTDGTSGSTGYGSLQENSNFTFGFSGYGDLFNGPAQRAMIGSTTPIDTGSAGFQAKVGGYTLDFSVHNSGIDSLSTYLSDNSVSLVAYAFRYDASDATAKLRVWGSENGASGSEITASRSNPSPSSTDPLGSNTRPLYFGGTVTGTNPTKMEWECAWLAGVLTDSEMAAITANPADVIEVYAAVPAAPSGVTSSSVSYTSASISWTDNSSDETGFKVRYSPSPYSSWTTATGSVAASPYLVTGLTDATSYKAAVAAFNGSGDSTWAESGVFTTSTLSKLRPNTDTSAGSWSASSGSVLYSMIDETSADDTDYITTAASTTCKLKFETSTDPADNSNHRIYLRARSTSGTLTVRLVQGDPAETTIVSWVPTLTSSFATYQYDLSTAEASVITDYSALYLKLTSS